MEALLRNRIFLLMLFWGIVACAHAGSDISPKNNQKKIPVIESPNTKSPNIESLKGITNYQALTFLNADINERADIKDILPQLQVQASERTATEVDDIAINDVKLSFAKEILDVLENASLPSDQYLKLDDSACNFHENFDPSVFSSLSVKKTCKEKWKTITKTFSNFKKTCRYATQAERFVEEQQPGKVSFWQLNSLEGLIKTAGEALSHITFPANIVNNEFRQKMRSIIIKIRYDDLHSNLRKQIKNYRSVEEILKNDASCFQSSPQHIQQLQSSVESLDQELSRVLQSIKDIDKAGRAEATAERKDLEAKGRYRDTLPYPALTNNEREWLSMFLGGIYWRMRGGGLLGNLKSTQITRIYFNYLPMRALAYLNGGNRANSIAQSIFFRIFKSWSKYMDMGRTSGDNDVYYDLVHMTDRGLYQVESAAEGLVADGFDPTDLRIGGLQMGPCYYYAWEKLSKVFLGEKLQAPYTAFIDGPTSWGEFCAGASISLGLSKSLLQGY